MADLPSVVFDVGNVLIRWNPWLVYRDMAITDAEISAFFEDIDFPAWNLEQDRGRSWADGVAEAIARCPRHATLIEKFHRDWQMAVPGAIEGSVLLLERLGRAGVPLYAITNFSTEKWMECQERFPFLSNGFLDIIVSAHEGVVKPDPAIFGRFLERSGVAAGECVFIDDSPANVRAARSLGMDALLFTDPKHLEDDLRARGLAL